MNKTEKQKKKKQDEEEMREKKKNHWRKEKKKEEEEKDNNEKKKREARSHPKVMRIWRDIKKIAILQQQLKKSLPQLFWHF
jgi:hypothetical protein